MNKRRSFFIRIALSNLAIKFYVFLIIMVALFAVMNWLVMPWYVRDGGTVAVPNVVGMEVSRAKVVLDTTGLHLEQGGTESSREPVNTVLSQNPDAKSIVKRGRRVYLILSGGVEKASVPDLRGHSEREAQFMLERAGLALGGVTTDSSSVFPQNVVMSQSIAPNTMLNSGSAVSIVVSSGAAIAGQVSVPDLVGQPLSEAQRQIVVAGLSLGKIVFQPSSRLVPNTVLEQYPRSNDLVPKGTAINLYVSSLPSQEGAPEN